jgi:outer membrane lipoprotein-sorting protein
MKNYYSIIILFVAVCNIPFAAELPDGDEIARRINARNEGEAVSRLLTMEMTDSRGKQRIRETKAFRKYYGEEKHTVIFYLAPKNIKDTGFLTYDYPEADKDDDQWLYLPAMRKVRRISASDRGDYFLGTDFTYEDIKLETRVSIDDYQRHTLGENEIDGFHCLLLESIPVNDETAAELGYSKVEQCVDDNIWMVRQAKMWDVQGRPLKTIHFGDIRQVQDIWTQHELTVTNHKTGHQTRFIFSEVQYNEGIKDRLFTQNALKRGL